MRCRAVAATLLLVLAAACQPLPQPFQPGSARKAANPLLQIRDGYGIRVAGVAGTAIETGEVLADAVAAALVDRNLPAYTGPSSGGSYDLSGTVAEPTGRAGAPMRLIWVLRDMHGAAVGRRSLDTGLTRAALSAASPGVLRGLAERSADSVAAIVQEPAPVDRIGQKEERSVYVRPVEGAPEAAGTVLREEAEAALRRLDLRIASGPGTADIVVGCTVALGAAKGGKRRLGLDWRILGPGGAEIGRLTQENALTPAELDRHWPSIARAIADGVADGVRDVLDRLPAKAGGSRG